MKITDKHALFFGAGDIFDNFHRCKITAHGYNFVSSEQLFMYEKAVFFGDMEIAEKIGHSESPAEAKSLGREVKNFDEDAWTNASYDIMKKVVLIKFMQNPELQKIFEATRGRKIAEASPHDLIWGIGIWDRDDRVHDESEWRGQNKLGRVMMEVREIVFAMQEKEKLEGKIEPVATSSAKLKI